MNPIFLPSPSAFRAWLQEHHRQASELWVGFHRKETGRPSMTWNEAVDEALCFGWIDGVRRSAGEGSWVMRFSPRRERSIWSDKNIRRMNELIAQGRVEPAGLAAFGRRREDLSRRYSFEQGEAALPEEYAGRIRANPGAWTFYQAQPPSYRRTVTWWIISAKREETRNRRLETLIRHSAEGERIPALQRPQADARDARTRQQADRRRRRE